MAQIVLIVSCLGGFFRLSALVLMLTLPALAHEVKVTQLHREPCDWLIKIYFIVVLAEQIRSRELTFTWWGCCS